MTKLPELLAPAGTPRALQAAIEGGADAVYLGGPHFNARLRAENFSAEAMRESIRLAHAYGLRAYVTLNTLVTDRELPAFLDAAYQADLAGADALIVADLGGADAIHRAMPHIELHASTQASGHNKAAARELAALGFRRMVLAREAKQADMAQFAKECGMETEIFVHGALCVSHSGQCLFSSLVGGRSGNRGACAQPCRLPDKNGKYPLSLKDLCLAPHVPRLIAMGVHSLKIEGRLKPPEYVRDVVRIWRRLLDECRAATPQEMEALAAIFSRGGFTDAYFKGTVGHGMLGVRSEADKATSREAIPFTGITHRVPLSLALSMKKNMPLTLTATANGKTVTVAGDIPLIAQNAPMNEQAVREKLLKLGNSPYEATDVTIALDEGLMVPVSHLNALRRAALAALMPEKPVDDIKNPILFPLPTKGERVTKPTARFIAPAQIPQNALTYFEHIYLPLDRYAPPADGVVLPAVIFDSEQDEVRQKLQKAVADGARHALVGNVGHLSLALEVGLLPHGDFRLNITNQNTLSLLLHMGFVDALLSPELTLPQIRDIKGCADAIIYGRIPLMTLEKCVGKELGSCAACQSDRLMLTDRRGEQFPVLREAPHRSIICNSRPTVMSDKHHDLANANILGGHFIFTTETAKEAAKIIDDYKSGTAPTGPVRRI